MAANFLILDEDGMIYDSVETEEEALKSAEESFKLSLNNESMGPVYHVYKLVKTFGE